MRPEVEKLRSITELELVSIKRVTDATLDLAGGITVAAMRTRSSGSQLSKYANFCHPYQDGAADTRERYVPLDVAIELDRAAGSPAILSVYAELLGFEIIPKRGSDEELSELSEMDALDFLCRAGQAAEEIRKARADGRIDPHEEKLIDERLFEVKRCLNRLLRKNGGGA